MPRLRTWARLLLVAWLLPWPLLSAAHEMSMAEMQVREVARGEFAWRWSATNDKRPETASLVPRWPEGCVADEGVVRCGPGGLSGPVSIDGVGEAYSAVLMKVLWLDGQSSVHTFTSGQPTAVLYGAATDQRDRGAIAKAYTLLGVEHILGGYDHLLFVLALLFLVGFQRKLLWTITAFTAAHSLSLASAALGLVTLRSPPVEATIALSIVLVAYEALSPRETLARRWPAALAFLFGLVHGLGFAGALEDIGLPQNYLPTALLTFNIGVELGQLLTIGAAWVVWRLLRDWPPFVRARTPVLYGIGSLAAFWTWSRVAAILA